MADVSKIKLPDGTTYNIKDTTSGYVTTSDIADKVNKFNIYRGTEIDDGIYAIDKTQLEIIQAYWGGKYMLFIAAEEDMLYPFLGMSGSTLIFGYSGTYNNTIILEGYSIYQVNDRMVASKLSSTTTIPTKVSQLTNDSGFITGYTETDPTVPSWAKASTKPTYTASEVGAVPTSRTINGKALSNDITLDASDIGINPANVVPSMDGTAAVGISNKYAREDHVHPTDTSRQKDLGIDSVGTATVQSLEYYFIGDTNDNTVLLPTSNALSLLMTRMGALMDGKVDTSSVGAASGVAPLDANSKIDSQYLPSYVDDVIEAYPVSGATALSAGWLSATSGGSALTPESGKIYVLMADSGDYSTNTQFRWGGTTYVKLSDGGVSSITNAEIDVIVAS